MCLVFIVISHTLLPLTNARGCGNCNFQTDRCENCSVTPAAPTPTTKPRTTKPFRTTKLFKTTKPFRTTRSTNSPTWNRWNRCKTDCRCIGCSCRYNYCTMIHTPFRATNTSWRLKPRRTTASPESPAAGIAYFSAICLIVVGFIIYYIYSCCKCLFSKRNEVGETHNHADTDRMGISAPAIIHHEEFRSDSRVVPELHRVPATPVATPRECGVHSNYSLTEIVVSFSATSEEDPPPYSLHHPERTGTPPPSYESVVNNR